MERVSTSDSRGPGFDLREEELGDSSLDPGGPLLHTLLCRGNCLGRRVHARCHILAAPVPTSAQAWALTMAWIM